LKPVLYSIHGLCLNSFFSSTSYEIHKVSVYLLNGKKHQIVYPASLVLTHGCRSPTTSLAHKQLRVTTCVRLPEVSFSQ